MRKSLPLAWGLDEGKEGRGCGGWGLREAGDRLRAGDGSFAWFGSSLFGRLLGYSSSVSRKVMTLAVASLAPEFGEEAGVGCAGWAMT